MTLRELAAEVGATPRHIRFLIAEGLCPPPDGGRKFATYGEEHLEAVRRCRTLRQMGFPLEAVRQLQKAGRIGAPFVIAEGITLVIASERFGSGAPVEPLLEQVRGVLETALRAGGDPWRGDREHSAAAVSAEGQPA